MISVGVQSFAGTRVVRTLVNTLFFFACSSFFVLRESAKGISGRKALEARQHASDRFRWKLLGIVPVSSQGGLLWVLDATLEKGMATWGIPSRVACLVSFVS